MPSIAQPSDRYIIEKIMPVRRVHIMAGPSGAGKTTYILQILRDWLDGKPIWGYPSYPGPVLYICVDRTEEEFYETLERTGIKLSIPVFSVIDNKADLDISLLLQRAPKIVPKVKLIVVEGIGRCVPKYKISDPDLVSAMLVAATRAVQPMGAATLGSVHSPKTKENERYLNPRERISGTAIWAAYSSLIVLVEPVQVQNPANRNRQISILPRNAGDMTLNYRLDERGCLVERGAEETAFVMEQAVRRLNPEECYRTGFLLDLAESAGITRGQAEEWLPKGVDDGILEKIRHGMFRVRRKT